MRKAAALIALCALLGASSALAQAPQAGDAPPAAESPPLLFPEGTVAPPADYPTAQQVPPPPPLQVYTMPPAGQVPMGPGVNEEMYRRNRTVALVGKVLTVIAPVLFMAAVGAALANDYEDYDDYTSSGAVVGLATTSFLFGTAGRVTWAAADLKMTNRLNQGGARIRRGAAITSTVMASLSWIPYLNFVTTPGTWIAGSLASSRIREAHDQLGPRTATLMPYSMPTGRGFSTGFTLKF